MIGHAHAHVGHLGEVAGHSHWIGVGVIVIAGTLAGLLGKLKQDADAEEDEPSEAEGEAA